ncbi:MAG: hypothetical protein HN348_17100 [Proteobacteria bacterium]|jgi:uncharacterized secreted protein with C-terminal beta-propeller domain|nr:hypothetical protein [Pseudomonadota bacterium]
MNKVFGCGAILALFVGSGCQMKAEDGVEPGDGDAIVKGRTALHQFKNCSEMMDYLVDAAVEDIVESRYGMQYGWGGGWGFDVGVNATEDVGGSPSDYSTTNTQEEGVDEVDIVKTDGNYIYVVEDGEFHIVKSWPAPETEIISTVELGGWAEGLFVDGDRAVVFHYDYDDRVFDRGDYYSAGFKFTVLDISDRTEPEIVREIDFEGSFADARMIDGQVYGVLRSYINTPREVWDLAWGDELALPEYSDWEETELERQRKKAMARVILRPHIAAIYADTELEDIMPRMIDQSNGGEVVMTHECHEVYRPSTLSRTAMLSLVNLDLSNDAVYESVGLLADGWTVYASEDNLYIGQSSQWWWGWSNDMETAIHKFELGNGAPKYRATGSVDGWMLNQFSMSEYNGYLRVATTNFDWWWGTTAEEEEPGNNLFVLQEQEDLLVPISGITGLAPGEQIYSVRMMGEKAYMVTFERVDPLFTIDLSNPYHPKLLGELKIPGYSAYLHPLGEDHLLAVGMDGNWDGTITGVAVSIFDVSDMSNPQLAHQYPLSDAYSYSEALWDHHAFTFHRGVLSIPAYEYYPEYFNGLVVMDIDTTEGITELGRVDHYDLDSKDNNVYMRRSLYIEDNLFSLSNVGIKVSELTEPENEITSVVYRQ